MSRGNNKDFLRRNARSIASTSQWQIVYGGTLSRELSIKRGTQSSSTSLECASGLQWQPTMQLEQPLNSRPSQRQYEQDQVQ